jgi:hypothetical protein
MRASIAAMQRALGKLVAMQDKRDAQVEQAQAPTESSAATALVTTDSSSILVEAHTLAGCFYHWYVLQLWQTATNKKQQFSRADLKACINIMLIASVPTSPYPVSHWIAMGCRIASGNRRCGRLLRSWTRSRQALGLLDNKGRGKTAGLLRKRWRKLRVENGAAFDSLCSVNFLRKGNGGIVDHCTPDSHM